VAVNSAVQQSTGEVIGNVVNLKNKEPLLRARLVIDDNGSLYQAYSEPDGRFRIPSVPSGKYYVTIILKTDTMRNIPLDVPIEPYVPSCATGKMMVYPVGDFLRNMVIPSVLQ